ncbi:MAG TPA: ATP synthase F0 subunit B [Pyrinomonadaceae bacterium]|nr:ATP synthase F0 subunit B [Pyrinomonadaceae bacterium]
MVLLAFAESIQLFPDGTLFIHVALILIMIWVLNRTFFRPINNVIGKRDKQKGGKGGEAESILKDVSQKESFYNKSLLEARSQGYDLIEKLRSEAVAERAARTSAAKEETARRLAEQKAELKERSESARADIAVEAEKMADKIAANILKV